jgi:hypothetical protein
VLFDGVNPSSVIELKPLYQRTSPRIQDANPDDGGFYVITTFEKQDG